jgi:transcriptional regulator with XRE-family HTH domain
MPTKVDIGKLIKETVRLNNVSIAEFAEKINCTQRNVYKIFNKQSIDTALLTKISKALEKNFFVFYLTEEEMAEFKLFKSKEAELLNTVKDLTVTIAYLKSLKKDKLKK